MWEILVGWFVLSCIVSPMIGLALRGLETAPRIADSPVDAERSRMHATENEIGATRNVEIGALQIAQNCP
jgi:hypothetical protein